MPSSIASSSRTSRGAMLHRAGDGARGRERRGHEERHHRQQTTSEKRRVSPSLHALAATRADSRSKGNPPGQGTPKKESLCARRAADHTLPIMLCGPVEAGKLTDSFRAPRHEHARGHRGLVRRALARARLSSMARAVNIGGPCASSTGSTGSIRTLVEPCAAATAMSSDARGKNRATFLW